MVHLVTAKETIEISKGLKKVSITGSDMTGHLRCRAVCMRGASHSIRCSREKSISRYVFSWLQGNDDQV